MSSYSFQNTEMALVVAALPNGKKGPIMADDILRILQTMTPAAIASAVLYSGFRWYDDAPPSIL